MRDLVFACQDVIIQLRNKKIKSPDMQFVLEQVVDLARRRGLTVDERGGISW